MNNHRWKLSNEEYEFVKEEVCHLIMQYHVKCIPVSGFEIAARMNITLITYSGLSKIKLEAAFRTSSDGFFMETDGHEYIYYNDIDLCHERQNWTVLHEIGHIVLDHIGHSDHEENEADFFAKYAVAPPVLIHNLGAQSPWDIYSAFDISMEEATYAFHYYLLWKNHFERVKRLTKYEADLLAYCRISA